jgi:hypothetical protein
MMFKFQTNTKCENAKECQDNFEKKILTLLPDYSKSINGHISCHHKENDHTWFVFLYDNGKHESFENNNIITQKFHGDQQKYKYKKPTEKELKDLI